MSMESQFMARAGTLAGPVASRRRRPAARYVLPQFEERTAYGFKRQDPYPSCSRTASSSSACRWTTRRPTTSWPAAGAGEQDPDRDIILYINSPGGSFTALTAIYDTMQYIKPHIQTVCSGRRRRRRPCCSRRARPASGWPCPTRGCSSTSRRWRVAATAASDIEIHANELIRMREWLELTIAHHTGRDIELVRKDIERDKILTAQAALEYGIVDQVLASRKGVVPTTVQPK